MNVREMRAAAAAAHPQAVPCGAGRSQPFRAHDLRASMTKRNGLDFYQVEGYASTVETPYEMYDMFGPYNEVVSAGAFDRTLASNPDVPFLVNHAGVTMARTKNGTLELSADETGLHVRAYLNPARQDVRDLVSAIEDGLVDEMSFAFLIRSGLWSPDYSEYRIDDVDIDRGDVSAVNFGANPTTSIAARSAEVLRMLQELPAGAQRAALDRLSALQPEAVRAPSEEAVAPPVERGRSVVLLERLAASLAD